MRRSYSLAPCNGAGTTLDFEWDPDTGEVASRDAAEVRQLATDAMKAGYWLGHPQPTPYKIVDALHRPSEMAVLLGNIWRLPRGKPPPGAIF